MLLKGQRRKKEFKRAGFRRLGTHRSPSIATHGIYCVDTVTVMVPSTKSSS